jgi:VanZ family protein
MPVPQTLTSDLMARLFDPRTRRMFAALWALAWLGIAALLLSPLPAAGPAHSDLVAHFLLFGGMAFATVSFSHRAGQLASLTLATIAAATALEFAQRLVPYRTLDLIDAVANALGATSGYALALVVLLLWIRPADPALRARRLART